MIFKNLDDCLADTDTRNLTFDPKKSIKEKNRKQIIQYQTLLKILEGE